MTASFLGRHSFWSNLNDSVFHVDPENLPVRAEQLRTRMGVYPALIGIQTVAEPIFVWMFWGYAPHSVLLLWLAGIYALHAVEVVNWAQHKNALNTVHDCRTWHSRFTLFAILVGLFWGTGAAIVFPSGIIAFQGLLISVMLSLVAGAVTTNPVHLPTLYGYTFPIMILLAARVAFENDPLHWILALILFMFLVVVILAGRGLNRSFILSLQQRFENISLLQQLTAQKREIEEARNQLERTNAVLQDHERKLEEMVQARTSLLQLKTKEIVEIKDTTILALTSLAGTRDNETGNHIRRTQNYVRALAIHLRDHPRFRHYLTDENIEMLFKIAPLHDIGKVGIPDYILHKPGKLTPEEFEIMKTHTTLGGSAISGAENMTKVRNSPFLKAARQIAIGHHEKWNGNGYPFALHEDNISIPGRLMAVADVYDAMSCRRVYKAPMEHDEVAETIIAGKGEHFDPAVVDAFVAVIKEFKEIAAKYQDEDLSDAGFRLKDREG